MLAWLRRLFAPPRAAPVVVSPGAFPDIDASRIALELDLRNEGARRGRRNLPDADDAGPDEIERAVVDRVGALRRQGLEHSSEHERVYRERIERGHALDAEIQDAANRAETEFRASAVRLNGDLEGKRNFLRDRKVELEIFQREHNIWREAHDGGGLAQWLALSLVIVLLESALNGVFFSNAHEMGLAGGAFTALGISIINVGGASLFGYLIRNFNHDRLWRKLTGFLSFAFVVSFAVSFNVFVANFRDAMTDAQASWDRAAGRAIDAIAAARLPESVDAWLLALLGCLATAIAGWKAYGAGDPFPGYGRVWRSWEDAQDDYQDTLIDAVDKLTETRDEASGNLKAAYERVRRDMRDAGRASGELVSLIERHKLFLDDCDAKVNFLLRSYREANRGQRTKPAPGRFGDEFRFPPAPPPSVPQWIDENERFQKIVREATQRIHDAGAAAIKAIDALQSDETRETRSGAGETETPR